jgi:hypothetical protein
MVPELSYNRLSKTACVGHGRMPVLATFVYADEQGIAGKAG